MRKSLTTAYNKKYLKDFLELIRINVIRCKWAVSWGVAYGAFTISATKELLNSQGIKFESDDDVISAAHYIATKMENMRNEDRPES